MVSRRSNVVDVKETCIKSVMYVQRSCFGLKSNWFFTLSLSLSLSLWLLKLPVLLYTY